MLGEAYPAFLDSYKKEASGALRVNTLKGSREDFLKCSGFDGLRELEWEKNGFYYNQEERPGKNPLHEAGVYYIQEPSAMTSVSYLDVRPGEKILDLCAAPGGKSTQTASCMKQEGILVCNEINPQRAKILSENVERMGIRNALVINEPPERLADVFDEYFDRILVDAPCSGEGMFRKNNEAIKEWSPENVMLCAKRQDEILDCADRMLRYGGRLVYSTCTFAPEENEGSVARFLKRHPEYRLVQTKRFEGMSEGNADWYDGAAEYKEQLKNTIRIFPHMLNAEGHFIAVFEKGEGESSSAGYLKNGVQAGLSPKELKDLREFYDFLADTLTCDGIAGLFGQDTAEKLCDFHEGLSKDAAKRILRFGDQLYLMPADMPSINGIRALRPGLHLGTLKKNRFEPSHALALSLGKDDVKRSLELNGIDGLDNAAIQYINGMTLQHSGEKGWYLMTYRGYSLGWGKLAGNIMKNHYPKGLRKQT